jgi:hypothetical protein
VNTKERLLSAQRETAPKGRLFLTNAGFPFYALVKPVCW